ncbi:hypothetical protein NIES4072_29860 [Nostoc commune NIES-4072]|uniref:Uncharacterized protein n=1 Tax=Nostoc commune NIES-4072 TaxID=2005467 RepID=A0A2R5FMR3_NOSCO|nr:hypothetical protein [Nostoc commune]BBD69679.1 hypothetical protein NIES4070_60890 [Nostoc commune HK-02]GBG19319.1 hypothetical protein NIES4072_29860 [Nostoc commune NIES-4072]
MASRWLKTNCLLASATAFWLTALSPVPAIAKGISYSLALVASVQLVGESRRLIVQDARRAALAAMNQELEQTEIALHSKSKRFMKFTALHRLTLRKLERHLYKEPSAEQTGETSTSTSVDKAFYLAIKGLLEVKGETYMIEQVLKMGGRRWEEGKRRLQQILQQGRQEEWD